MMDLNFKGKTVLVTGSTRGIGRAIAELFAEHGATVVVNGREEKRVRAAAEELRGRGFSAEGIAADVRRAGEVAVMADEIRRRFGRLDVLVNNAALVSKNVTERISEPEWNDILDTNLKGVFLVTRAFLPIMKEQGSGAIVNIASQAVVYGSIQGGIHYTASKGGVVAFTRGLAKELGPSNIRVNAVMPGLVETEMTKRFIERESDLKSFLMNYVALGRHGRPEEIAPAVLFLASGAASYVTGEILAINGGSPSVLFL